MAVQFLATRLSCESPWVKYETCWENFFSLWNLVSGLSLHQIQECRKPPLSMVAFVKKPVLPVPLGVLALPQMVSLETLSDATLFLPPRHISQTSSASSLSSPAT